MRVLLDECVDERLRHAFSSHDCQTARYAHMSGLKNGDLLSAAEATGFDVLVTADKGIAGQQNMLNRQLAVLVLCGRTNRLADLLLLVPAALRALDSIRPGELLKITEP